MKIKCIFLCCMFLSYITYATNYYFSESLGNDSWSGRFPVPNGNNTDGPKKSLIALNTLLDNLAKPGDSILLRRCLLYTSPSPRDRTRSRMPSSA